MKVYVLLNSEGKPVSVTHSFSTALNHGDYAEFELEVIVYGGMT